MTPTDGRWAPADVAPAPEAGTPDPARLSPETVRTLRRVGANYARLATTFTLGLILVPVLLGWLGDDAFGLLSVMGSSIGLTTIVLEILDRAMIRELGEAHHSRNPARFLRTYNSALVLAWIAAGLFAAACAVLIPLVALLNIPAELVPAARWLAASEAASIVALVALAPAYNMYQVGERFGAYNLILVIQRSSYIIPALVLCYGLGVRGPARSLTLYAIGCAMINVAAVAVPVGIAMACDARLRPRPSLARAAEARAILRTFRAAGLVVVIVSSLERLAAVLGNLLLPGGRALGWNAAFGLSQRAVGHVRMAAEGLTRGLDAVSARMSMGEESGAGVRGLARSMTRLHALIALPAAGALFILAEPALWLWIGRSATNPSATIPRAVPMVQIMVFGLAARAVSDAWLSILYGAGQIGRVARVFFGAGLFTPAAVAGLTLALPAPLDELGPALAVAGSMVVIQFAIFVVPAARAMGTSAADLLAPIVRPAIAATVACAVPLAALWLVPRWSLPLLLAVLAAFGLVYGAVAWGVALSGSERRRLVSLARGGVGALRPGPVERPLAPEEEVEADAGRIGPGL